MEKHAVNITNLSFSYGAVSVLDDCTFNIDENTITVLLGANGAGKSTLFSCLMKQQKVNNQTIKIDSKPIEELSLKSLSRMISYVPQINTIADLDCVVRDYLVEGRTPYLSAFSIPGREEYLIAEKYASMIGITHLLSKNLQHLSGGELQLVLVARALVQETPIIIMDEPMSALDLGNQAKILKLIKLLKENGKTVIFSSHNPNHALILGCNVCMLKNGKIVSFGNAQECITQQNIKELYGNDISVKETEDYKVCFITLD